MVGIVGTVVNLSRQETGVDQNPASRDNDNDLTGGVEAAVRQWQCRGPQSVQPDHRDGQDARGDAQPVCVQPAITSTMKLR